jgi:MFS family permease
MFICAPRSQLLRFVAGLGLGAATMITPTYVSENSPRAVRGALTGLYQLFETGGAMIAFWIDFGSQQHISGNAQWIVPIAMQALPASLLGIGMIFCSESPRFLAKKDKWEESTATLCKIRELPESHPYIQAELQEMQIQLQQERSLVDGSGMKSLMRELWFVPANRKRAFIAIGLMISQQMTGTLPIVLPN